MRPASYTRSVQTTRPIAVHDLEEDGAPIASSRQAAVPLESAQSTYGDVDNFAREMLKTKRGIGMTPPFYAETASMKGNQSCSYWIVRNTYCNSLVATRSVSSFPKNMQSALLLR